MTVDTYLDIFSFIVTVFALSAITMHDYWHLRSKFEDKQLANGIAFEHEMKKLKGEQ